MALADLPRVPLGIFPTPVQHVPDLAGTPGLRDVLVKRDDLTGFAWGGNKVRTLEPLFGEAPQRALAPDGHRSGSEAAIEQS